MPSSLKYQFTSLQGVALTMPSVFRRSNIQPIILPTVLSLAGQMGNVLSIVASNSTPEVEKVSEPGNVVPRKFLGLNLH